MKNYFSFGQNHIHKIDGKIFDKDCIVLINVKTAARAREIMFETFGDKWSMHYTKLPDMSFFPRGVIEL